MFEEAKGKDNEYNRGHLVIPPVVGPAMITDVWIEKLMGDGFAFVDLKEETVQENGESE